MQCMAPSTSGEDDLSATVTTLTAGLCDPLTWSIRDHKPCSKVYCSNALALGLELQNGVRQSPQQTSESPSCGCCKHYHPLMQNPNFKKTCDFHIPPLVSLALKLGVFRRLSCLIFCCCAIDVALAFHCCSYTDSNFCNGGGVLQL